MLILFWLHRKCSQHREMQWADQSLHGQRDILRGSSNRGRKCCIRRWYSILQIHPESSETDTLYYGCFSIDYLCGVMMMNYFWWCFYKAKRYSIPPRNNYKCYLFNITNYILIPCPFLSFLIPLSVDCSCCSFSRWNFWVAGTESDKERPSGSDQR